MPDATMSNSSRCAPSELGSKNLAKICQCCNLARGFVVTQNNIYRMFLVQPDTLISMGYSKNACLACFSFGCPQ